MCLVGWAKCLGCTLIPLAILGTLANILLFFPGAHKIDNNTNLSEEVWYFGGILGCGVLMFNTMLFAGTGIVGALYAFAISVVAISRGPKCFVGNDTWKYPFCNGNYLTDRDSWSSCIEPLNIVPWNLSLFSIQLIISSIQMLLCSTQVVKSLFAIICENGCCPEICGRKETP
ncbi:transmembrane 4 L6 family member 4-like isoform X1 [Petaurus breviceps papuanus]|uniref:transmembrane 4 L6 family member 4-like isoform X1 n=1 Tax=Petaurus breviceps papuanus TaxID=3040969 RepID=UPI0036D9F6E1